MQLYKISTVNRASLSSITLNRDRSAHMLWQSFF